MPAFQTLTIGEFCKTGSGSTPSRSDYDRFYANGTIPWVKSGELREGVIHSTEEYVTEHALKESSIKLVPAGALLLAMYGATVGRLALLGIEATTNQAVCHIIPDPKKADIRYLFHAISHQVPQIIALGVGGAQPNINQAIIKGLKVQLPPLPEQRRIAAILDQADALRAKRREALAELDRLTQSIFVEMFGDVVRNDKGWDEQALHDVADIRSGVTKGKKIDESTAVTLPYMRVANVQDGFLDLADIQMITVSPSDAKKCRLEVGDILLTEGGDIDKLGRGYVWNGEIENCIHQNHIFSVRIKNKRLIVPEFLSAVISSQRGKRYFLKVGKQTTGIATINKTVLSEFRPIIPPIELQDRYIEITKKIKLIKKDMGLDTIDSLFTSLQHRAFRGEL